MMPLMPLATEEPGLKETQSKAVSDVQLKESISGGKEDTQSIITPAAVREVCLLYSDSLVIELQCV